MRVFREAHFQFLSWRRRAYIISAVVIVGGLASILVKGGFDAGVEFTGGTLLQVRTHEPTSVAELRALLNEDGFTGEQIQPLTPGPGAEAQEEEYLIRLPTPEGEDLQVVRARVTASMSARFGEDGFEVLQGEGIGPKVGSELRTKAIIALSLSFLLTLIYLAFRFEWRFGFAAVIATMHDLAVTAGAISVLNIEITLATVAALLTIVGYSLNDTIVVFDRVRENLKKKRKEGYEETLDRSINETLPRTVLTSGTTLVALISLFVLGGTVIRPFALVLILGVLVGTYSSIFVASPVLLEINDWARRRKARPAHAATG